MAVNTGGDHHAARSDEELHVAVGVETHIPSVIPGVARRGPERRARPDLASQVLHITSQGRAQGRYVEDTALGREEGAGAGYPGTGRSHVARGPRSEVRVPRREGVELYSMDGLGFGCGCGLVEGEISEWGMNRGGSGSGSREKGEGGGREGIERGG